jgi:prepilin peptidase dependent protein B
MHVTPRAISRRAAPAQRGLSLVELMVGIALGLFLVAGASTLFVSHLTSSRRLLQEARLNQDLRATADLITRDLRRAGYWGNALQGTVATGAGSTTTANPYSAVTSAASTVSYEFSQGTEDNTLTANEQFGFDLNSGKIRMLTGGVPQDVTDPDTMTVTAFTITPTVTAVDIRDSCAVTCTGGACPTITVREFDISITGQSTRDAAVTRTLQTSVRVRNDLLAGTCPS